MKRKILLSVVAFPLLARSCRIIQDVQELAKELTELATAMPIGSGT